MENHNKNKIFIQIFLSFFLLFFLVLVAFAYNVNEKNEIEVKKEDKKFISLVLATSESNMNLLENYLTSLRNNTIFLEFIASDEHSATDNYNFQRKLFRDREMIGQENIDIGAINIDEDIAIFTEDSYTVGNYSRLVGFDISKLEDEFMQIEGDYLVKYIPYRLSNLSDRAVLVLKLRKDFLQRIFYDKLNIDWYIKIGEDYIRVRDFTIVDTVPEIEEASTSGLLKENVYYVNKIYDGEAKFQLLWQLLVGLFFINILSYLLAKIIFKVTYNPLEETLEQLEHDNAKSINEYMKLKELHDNLKRENVLVEKRLEDSNFFLSKKYLKEFIQGILTYSKLVEKIGKDPAILKMGSYQVIIVKRIDNEGVFMRTSDTLIRSEIERMMKESYQKIESLDLSYNITLYIVAYDESKVIILEKMISYFQKKYSMKLEVAVSGKLRNLVDVQKEYTTMIKYFEHNLDTNGVITRENIESVLKRKYYYPLSVEQDLMTKISKGDVLGVKGLIVKIFYENLQERGIGEEEQKTLRILMLNTLRRVRSVLDLGEKKNKRIEAFISKLNLVSDLSFEDEYLKAIEVIMRGIGKKEKEEEKSDLKEKIEDFIQKNYTSEINLQDLADHIGYSQHYMSHVFKGLFKDSFRSKINSYRINKAKELMVENRNIKIYELAQRVGYNSSSSFIKIFKSVEGCSPGAYKEKIK